MQSESQSIMNQTSEDKSIAKVMDNFIADFFGTDKSQNNLSLWFAEKPWRP